MNDLLKQRIIRALDTLSEERGYQILDYIEFLESKYAERQRPTGIFAKLTETVEDTMRAGRLPLKAISGTMGIMDSAAKVMKGLAAAGQAVVDEAVRATEGETPAAPAVPPSGTPAVTPSATASPPSPTLPPVAPPAVPPVPGEQQQQQHG